MTQKDRITAERLRELLHYDPETGIWTWRAKSDDNSRAEVGDRAGSINNKGYWRLKINGEVYSAHRLAWLYMTGEWPSGFLDHKDMDRANCKWDNLRLATHGQNNANRKIPSNNTSGVKGVSYIARRKEFVAYISVDGKRTQIGYFRTIEDAKSARLSAQREYHGQFSREA